MCTKQQSNRIQLPFRAALFFPISAHQTSETTRLGLRVCLETFSGETVNSFEGKHTKINLLRKSSSDFFSLDPFHRFCLCFHHFPGIVVSSVTKLSNHKTVSIIIVTLWRLETGMLKMVVGSERQIDNQQCHLWSCPELVIIQRDMAKDLRKTSGTTKPGWVETKQPQNGPPHHLAN